MDSLPLFWPTDSLPQVFSADSSTGWFRNLFYADFARFRSLREFHSFILRFDARIVGRDSVGWYAVVIPDPGPDTAVFSLLSQCTGATHRTYVRPAYSRVPFLLRNGRSDE